VLIIQQEASQVNIRGASFVLSDNPDDDADFEVDAWMPGTIDEFMDWYFPWLDWELHEYIGEEEGSFEVAVHVLRAELSNVGKSALLLEEFFSSSRADEAATETDHTPDADGHDDSGDLVGQDELPDLGDLDDL
jgi:hypothetical protein